jgi:hypothetical protein
VYTNKEVGELLGSVCWAVLKFTATATKLYVVVHFVIKYW